MGQPLTAGAGAAMCGHCGLGAPVGDPFCCYGCELAHALTADDDGRRQRTVGALTLSLLLAMMVMMLSLFLYAEDLYEATADPLYVWFRHASSWVAAGLSSVVVALLGPPLARRALRAARSGRLTMELLIVLAAGAAWAVSIVSLLTGRAVIYFDSAVAALLLATFGRYIEARARSRAAGVIGPLCEPSSRPVRAGHDDVLELLSPAAIEPGMRVEVAPNGVVAVDMRATGDAEVSLAVLSGESEPALIRAGDEVPAGAVVLSGPLTGTALRRVEHSTLAVLERLTRALYERRGRLLRVADRLASALTPVVAAIAVAALVGWTLRSGLGAGIEVALAVVLVACPCTYGVIAPLIAWLSLKKALEHDVCIRDAAVLDALAGVDTVAFDKTGTLTEPLARVQIDVAPHVTVEDVLPIAVALERDVHHPVGRAIHQHGRGAGVSLSNVSIAARGVSGRTSDGQEVAIGAPSWLLARQIAVPDVWREHAAVLSREGEAVLAFDIDERDSDSAAPALAALAGLDVAAVVLSGDRRERVRRVALRLGITRWAGDLCPADKVELLDELDRPALVGDGINDAPAAAAALASFAVSGSASLNRGVADVVLLSADLRLVPWTLGLARRAMALTRHTLAAATLYNVVFVGLAASGLLRPVWAGASMLAASVIALAGALRMSAHPGVDEPSVLEPVEARA